MHQIHEKDTVVVSDQGIRFIRTFGVLFLKSIELFYHYAITKSTPLKGFMIEFVGKHFDYFFFFLFFLGGRGEGGGGEGEGRRKIK